MAKKKSAKPKPEKSPSESVFKEAWEKMSDDFNRLMPEMFRNKEKKKFVLWLFLVELVVLGVIGKFVYDWLVG